MTLQTGRAPRSALAWPPRWGLATVTPLTPTGCLGSRRPSAPVQPSLLLNGIRPGRFGPHGDVIVARPARPGSGRLSRPTRHPATVGGAVGGTVGRAGGALYSAATPSSRAILRSAVAMDPPRRAPGAPGEPSTACSRDLTTCRGPTRPLGPLGPGAVVARFSSLGDYINLHQPEGGTEGRGGGGGGGGGGGQTSKGALAHVANMPARKLRTRGAGFRHAACFQHAAGVRGPAREGSGTGSAAPCGESPRRPCVRRQHPTADLVHARKVDACSTATRSARSASAGNQRIPAPALLPGLHALALRGRSGAPPPPPFPVMTGQVSSLPSY